MKIVRFELENVKKVRLARIAPAESGLTVIGGKNHSGKTRQEKQVVQMNYPISAGHLPFLRISINGSRNFSSFSPSVLSV